MCVKDTMSTGFLTYSFNKHLMSLARHFRSWKGLWLPHSLWLLPMLLEVIQSNGNLNANRKGTDRDGRRNLEEGESRGLEFWGLPWGRGDKQNLQALRGADREQERQREPQCGGGEHQPTWVWGEMWLVAQAWCPWDVSWTRLWFLV